MAQNYVEQCVFGHNPSRTSQQSTFDFVGENTYATNEAANYTQAVLAWYSEVADYNFTSNTCRAGPGMCGHYTQVMNGLSLHMHNSRKSGEGTANRAAYNKRLCILCFVVVVNHYGNKIRCLFIGVCNNRFMHACLGKPDNFPCIHSCTCIWIGVIVILALHLDEVCSRGANFGCNPLENLPTRSWPRNWPELTCKAQFRMLNIHVRSHSQEDSL